MKVLKAFLLILCIGLIVIQFFRPDRENPPVVASQTVQAHLDVPENVSEILVRACYDCHSNETTWPWYTEIAPVSWFIAGHVQDGREDLSFSEWGTYDPGRADHKLEEICEVMESREMPLSSYVLLHPEAGITDAERTSLCAWAEAQRAQLGAGPSESE